MIVFDIETGSRPETEIAQLCPQFEAPANYKDAAKIAAYIEEKRMEWFGRAALSAVTGQVLAIGYMVGDNFDHFASGDEAEDIAAFWDLITEHGAITSMVVGFNCLSFDVPFLVRRSWKLEVPIPPTLFRGRWISESFVDLMDIWKCGNRDQSISLGDLGKFLGAGDKTGTGKDFARLLETDRAAALAYLENDVRLTARCARFLGVL
jgi:hypothetical protein